jgi:hypothetical protein
VHTFRQRGLALAAIAVLAGIPILTAACNLFCEPPQEAGSCGHGAAAQGPAMASLSLNCCDHVASTSSSVATGTREASAQPATLDEGVTQSFSVGTLCGTSRPSARSAPSRPPSVLRI